MQKLIGMAALALGVALISAPQAQAAALLRINVGATTLTCDTSQAFSGTNCGAGFSSALGSNVITFTGTVDGVALGGGGITGVQVVSNQPGTPALAFVLDTKTAVNNTNTTARTLTVDFAVNGFTQPTGPGFLNASQTANWTVSTSGDQQAFQAWERNDNALTVPGGTATAISPNCVSPGGLSQSCASETLNVAVGVTAPFALTGREIINMAAGTIASYTGTATLTATPVPEPVSMLLLGTGLLALARRRQRLNGR